MKVFVSGCFDMLHTGHIAFFEEASKLGELYVGIGSDSNILKIKGRQTVNKQNERLYAVKSIKYVYDAWVNSGNGLLDFEKEVLELKPDMFFVNEDGYSAEKQAFCDKHGIKLVISHRKPFQDLPFRSTTAIRQNCTIPYRIELCGGWLDQPMLNKLHSGSVITASIHPNYNFNGRSGMATSSRNKAIELWQTELPHDDYEKTAKMLFSLENPPGTKYISGSQDQIGIVFPGISKLTYSNGYWPYKIESLTDDATMKFLQDHICLMQLPIRDDNYDVYADMHINERAVQDLANASELAWDSIRLHDAKALGQAVSQCFRAQLEMFPNMITEQVKQAIDAYKDQLLGAKLTGAGGGGYLVCVASQKIKNSLSICIRT